MPSINTLSVETGKWQSLIYALSSGVQRSQWKGSQPMSKVLEKGGYVVMGTAVTGGAIATGLIIYVIIIAVLLFFSWRFDKSGKKL